MGCNCGSVEGVSVNAPPEGVDFPPVDPNGKWLVSSSGNATYAFGTLEDAKAAAEIIAGRVSQR